MSAGQPSGSGPKDRPAASMAPCASRSNVKFPDRLMNWRSDTDPSRWMKKDTSPSSGVLSGGRRQRPSTCATMFCKYSGNGNATPSVLTVATSLPVEGASPGSGAVFGVVRGAASRGTLSGALGGAAFETVLLGGGCLLGTGGGAGS